MYSSAFYKLAARARLKGNYVTAIIATLIYVIPSYLLTQLVTLFGNTILGVIINLLFVFFVLNIFNVGYMRFLLAIKPKEESDEKYDYNIILSGYTNNFRNALKTTFMRDVKLLGWGLLPIIPLIVFAGVAVAAICFSGDNTELYSYITQIMVSPTMELSTQAIEYFVNSYKWLIILFALAVLGMLVLMFPYVYKTYEYAAVEMIIADKPEMKSKKIFERSRDIMHGFRGRYFFLQMSFLLYQILVLLILQLTNSYFIYYLAQCMLLPYMNTTMLEFYRERTNILEYNASVYENNRR